MDSYGGIDLFEKETITKFYEEGKIIKTVSENFHETKILQYQCDEKKRKIFKINFWKSLF